MTSCEIFFEKKNALLASTKKSARSRNAISRYRPNFFTKAFDDLWITPYI